MELLPRLSNRDVLAQAVAMTADRPASARPASCRELTWQQALALVASHLQHLVNTGDYAAATVDKMLAEMGMLAAFMTDGLRKPFVADAGRGELRWWAGSKLGGRRRNGFALADATVRVRLYSAKLFLRVLRRLGLYAADPLRGLKSPGRSKRRTQPMSDEAILLARFSCNDLEGNYLLPSALAVCEATATSRELWAVLVVHIDHSQTPGQPNNHAPAAPQQGARRIRVPAASTTSAISRPATGPRHDTKPQARPVASNPLSQAARTNRPNDFSPVLLGLLLLPLPP